MSRRSVRLFAFAVLALTGCGQPQRGPETCTVDCGPAPQPSEEARSNLQRDLAPTVPASDLEALVAGNTDFALALHKLTRGSGNAISSPLSVSVALAMTWAGAHGDTEAQMAQALHFALPQRQLHPAFNALDLALMSRGQGAQGTSGNPFRLRVANRVWGQKDFPFEAAFLDTLAVHYGAGIGLLDFVGATEPSRLAINDWVAQQTQQKILNLLPEGSVGPDTRMVLTNAVYFNAAWASPFAKDATGLRPFHLLAGGSVDVPTMSGEAVRRSAQTAEYDAVELGYDGGELSMLLIAPAAGTFESFESALDAAKLNAILTALTTRSVIVTLPRFKFDFDASLSGPLKALGMPIAFTEHADFTGISARGGLAISDVLHKATISVDEEGTEAAAATAVIVGVTSVPPTINVDRPFLFAIRDHQTGAVVFLGRVVDPR